MYPPDKRANGTFVPIRVRKPKDENMYPSGYWLFFLSVFYAEKVLKSEGRCDRERELIRRMGSKGVDDIEVSRGVEG